MIVDETFLLVIEESESIKRQKEIETQEIIKSLTLQLREKEKQIEELKQTLKVIDI